MEQTPLGGPRLIGCESRTFTPSEGLFNLDIKAFFDKLKGSFDSILVEGACLNDFSDSRELALSVDGVFSIFSANDSLSAADYNSIKYISSLGEKNRGTVLNNVLQENLNY